jgi:hypothetical protein
VESRSALGALMLYAINYLFRVSDFLEVWNRAGCPTVMFGSFWYRMPDGVYIDVHEFGFVSAFGIAYKMVVEGESSFLDAPSLDNKPLAHCAVVVRKYFKERATFYGKRAQDLGLRLALGVVVDYTDCRLVFVPLSKFLEDRPPEYLPIVAGKDTHV